MAGKPRVEVDSKATRRALKKMGHDVAGHEPNREAGQAVLQASLRRVPRRTGRLAGSGRVVELRDGAAVIFGNASIPYAAVINWGWPRHSIQGTYYLQDRVRDQAKRTHDIYAKDVEKQVKRVDRAS